MSKKARRNYVKATSQLVSHKKMYKAKKQWIVASMTVLAMLGIGAIGHTNIHASVAKKSAPTVKSVPNVQKQASIIHKKVVNTNQEFANAEKNNGNSTQKSSQHQQQLKQPMLKTQKKEITPNTVVGGSESNQRTDTISYIDDTGKTVSNGKITGPVDSNFNTSHLTHENGLPTGYHVTNPTYINYDEALHDVHITGNPVKYESYVTLNFEYNGSNHNVTLSDQEFPTNVGDRVNLAKDEDKYLGPDYNTDDTTIDSRNFEPLSGPNNTSFIVPSDANNISGTSATSIIKRYTMNYVPRPVNNTIHYNLIEPGDGHYAGPVDFYSSDVDKPYLAPIRQTDLHHVPEGYHIDGSFSSMNMGSDGTVHTVNIAPNSGLTATITYYEPNGSHIAKQYTNGYNGERINLSSPVDGYSISGGDNTYVFNSELNQNDSRSLIGNPHDITVHIQEKYFSNGTQRGVTNTSYQIKGRRNGDTYVINPPSEDGYDRTSYSDGNPNGIITPGVNDVYITYNYDAITADDAKVRYIDNMHGGQVVQEDGSLMPDDGDVSTGLIYGNNGDSGSISSKVPVPTGYSLAGEPQNYHLSSSNAPTYDIDVNPNSVTKNLTVHVNKHTPGNNTSIPVNTPINGYVNDTITINPNNSSYKPANYGTDDNSVNVHIKPNGDLSTTDVNFDYNADNGQPITIKFVDQHGHQIKSSTKFGDVDQVIPNLTDDENNGASIPYGYTEDSGQPTSATFTENPQTITLHLTGKHPSDLSPYYRGDFQVDVQLRNNANDKKIQSDETIDLSQVGNPRIGDSFIVHAPIIANYKLVSGDAQNETVTVDGLSNKKVVFRYNSAAMPNIKTDIIKFNYNGGTIKTENKAGNAGQTFNVEGDVPEGYTTTDHTTFRYNGNTYVVNLIPASNPSPEPQPNPQPNPGPVFPIINPNKPITPSDTPLNPDNPNNPWTPDSPLYPITPQPSDNNNGNNSNGNNINNNITPNNKHHDDHNKNNKSNNNNNVQPKLNVNIKRLNNVKVGKTIKAHGLRISRLRVDHKNYYSWLHVLKNTGLYSNPFLDGKKLATISPKQNLTIHINRVFNIHGKHGNYLRYEVRQGSHYYFMTGNSKQVRNAYIQPREMRHHRYIRATRKIAVYKSKYYSKRTKLYNVRIGRKIRIKRVIHMGDKTHEITRFQLTNGRYITANRNYVKVI